MGTDESTPLFELLQEMLLLVDQTFILWDAYVIIDMGKNAYTFQIKVLKAIFRILG